MIGLNVVKYLLLKLSSFYSFSGIFGKEFARFLASWSTLRSNTWVIFMPVLLGQM